MRIAERHPQIIALDPRPRKTWIFNTQAFVTDVKIKNQETNSFQSEYIKFSPDERIKEWNFMYFGQLSNLDSQKKIWRTYSFM